jgi:type IV pilus assembly protein PilW
MKTDTLPSRRLLPQRGMTLVELMVSLAIGMVISLALLTLLINVNRNNAEMSRTNSVIENGRFSLQLLEGDLSHSGLWGGYVPSYDNLDLLPASSEAAGLSLTTASATTIVFPSSVPDPCPNDGTSWTQPSAWTVDYKAQLIAMPIQVYSVPSSGTSPVCRGTASLQGPLYSNVQPSTDVLVVRHMAPCVPSSSATDTDCQASTANTDGNLFFQSSRCKNDTSNWVLSTAASDLVLKDGKCGTGGVSPNYCFVFPLPDGCAQPYRFLSTIYWVRNYFITAGDGIPTLMRTRFQISGGVLKHTSSEALVDGVEAFRVELGVDNVNKSGTTLTAASFSTVPSYASSTSTYTPTNRGDGNADNYFICATGTGTSSCYDSASATTLAQSAFNLANTVAVKLHVLVRASTKTPSFTDPKKYTVAGTTLGPFTDGYKRHVYTQTVRLNNISMRRDLPPGL